MSSVARFLKEKDMLTLAAAVVIGAALQDVVRSLVNDIISPPINAYTGGFMSGELVIKKPSFKRKDTWAEYQPSATPSPSAQPQAQAPAAAGSNSATGAIVIKYGKFLSTILQLVLVIYVAYYFAVYTSKVVDALTR